MLLFVTALATSEAASPLGDWMTSDRGAIVRIIACPERPAALCGKIERLLDPADANARDDHDPDPAKRQQPVLGMRILSGFTPGANGWSGGRIYDPDTGRTYTDLDLRLKDDRHLVISKPASLLLIKAEVGQQIWTRVSP